MKLDEFIKFNPKESLSKGKCFKCVDMASLKPFTRKPDHFISIYKNGSKFRNGDTIMARITPCLENGKTSYINFLQQNEVAFGSTEFIVARAKTNVSLPLFIYYLLCSNRIREIAIGSMTGSSGRERVQQISLNEIEIPAYSISFQQHIVDTIGSVDSLIELNQEKISKIKNLAAQKYELLYKTYPKSAIGKRLKFIKGKQPKFASKEDGEPYLIIDDLASNIHTQFSSEGLVCDVNDVLMVMDGASSGKVFTGNKGYVGSTLAKLSSPQIKPSILYFGLSKFEEEIMKNTTGSAIPHTDKSFVSELRIVDDLDDKTTDFFNFCLNQICNLRTQNSLLSIQKEILLQKYFH